MLEGVDVEGFLLQNRLTFLVVLGLLVLVVFVWKRFKPRRWKLDEFEFHPFKVRDAPDIPIDAAAKWYIEGGENLALRVRVIGSPDARMEEEDPRISRYQEFIERRRAEEDGKDTSKKR